MRNDELVISSYYGLVFFLNLTLKKPTSHTLSIAIISNQMINGIFIQPYRIICFDLTDKKKNERIFFVLFYYLIDLN